MLTFFMIFIGICIIFIYISPLIRSKLNIGNIFGIILGGFLITFGCTYRQLFSSDILKTPTIIVLIAFAAFMLFYIYYLYKVIRSNKNTYNNENIIIVLGCRVKGTEPSRALRERCLSAAKCMENNPDSIAILTGGQGQDEGISEAECMKNVLIDAGIDKDRLIIENKATSTYENIELSRDIILKRHLPHSVAIATSDYHIHRSLLIAEKYGLSATGIPARSIPVLRVPYFTREALALMYMQINKRY